jgi:tRNA dimethylallyltransferase
MNASLFGQLSERWATEIFQQNKVAVMVGGTGLYVKAFCEGLDEIPAVAPSVRKKIQEQFNNYGIEWLQDEVKMNDPQYFSSGEIHNPQRMIRALEVKMSTGKSILAFRSNAKKQLPFTIKKIGLYLPKEQLGENIGQRVDHMMAKGLLDEAKKLWPYKKLNALQTVGYAELFDFLEDKISLEKATELIKTHTRQYAKRQMTWFKKDDHIEWIVPSDFTRLKMITES